MFIIWLIVTYPLDSGNGTAFHLMVAYSPGPIGPRSYTKPTWVVLRVTKAEYAVCRDLG